MVRSQMLTAPILASLCWLASWTTAAPVACNSSTPDLTRLQTFSYKPRIFILSDILNEPDDSMSLVRYLLYANEFDTRGLCAVTSGWLRNSTHPEQMRTIVNAYGEVVDTLNNHVHPNFTYQPGDYFLPLITSGPAVYGKRALNMSLSDGAQKIIDALQESDEPLYIPVWGGTNTLAQALQYMQKNMSEADAATQRAKLRVYAISDQDDTGAWIRKTFPDVSYIVSIHHWTDYNQATWIGMNSGSGTGPDKTKVLNPWLDAHIRLGKLGAVYPQVKYGMEGDSPSFLWLIQNGLGHRAHIEWGSWGGRYGRMQEDGDWVNGIDGNWFVDSTENAIGVDGSTYTTNKASIWRWRDAMQDDFAARMQWTLTSNFAEAGHPPVIDVNGSTSLDALTIRAYDNATYVLDATGTYDPDRPGTSIRLDYMWFWYEDVTSTTSLSYPGTVTMEALAPPVNGPALINNTAGFANYTMGPVIKVTAPPAVVNSQTGMPMPDFHIVLQVTNVAGPYPIRRYKRIIFTYS